MKVLLLNDVKNVGKKGQIVDVADGYAQNFLFKNKWAVAASKKSLEIRQNEIDDARALENKSIENAQKDKLAIENITLTFKLKSGKDGKMFGSISTKQIAEQLKNVSNLIVDKRKILSEAINNFGVTVVEIELHKNILAKLKVQVLPLE